jgi:glycosyltransferase 2 family protein
VSRKAAFFAGTLLISAAFTYLALRDVDFDDTWRALHGLGYGWLGLSTLAFLLSILVRAIRWQVLFEPGRRPPLWATTKAMLLGLFFNSILPARAGEAVRVVALRYYARVSLAESTATVVVERVFDVLSLLLLLLVMAPWLPHVGWLRTAAALGIALLVFLACAITAIVLYGERPIRFLLRPIRRLPSFREMDVDAIAANVNRGLGPLRRAGHGLLGFAWTMAAWLVMGLSFWFLMLSFDLHLPFLAALLTTVAVGLAFVIPAAPAALGVFEAAAIAATHAYGVPPSEGLAFALVLHALNLFPYLLAGLVLLALLPRRGWLKGAEGAV